MFQIESFGGNFLDWFKLKLKLRILGMYCIYIYICEQSQGDNVLALIGIMFQIEYFGGNFLNSFKLEIENFEMMMDRIGSNWNYVSN